MKTGIAIALAWPDTCCKKAGAWYDHFMEFMGISKEGYYRVGHAAVVLVELKTGNCHYFDFGRYHSPFGYGRIRDEETDHDLKILTKAEFDQVKRITNYDALLNEISNNEACHGAGALHAAYTTINFDMAFRNAKLLQDKSPLPYGPFTYAGTNCSRFVRQIILSGLPPIKDKVNLLFPITISPLPLGNVKSLKNYKIVGKEKNLSITSSEFKFHEICQIN